MDQYFQNITASATKVMKFRTKLQLPCIKL